MSALLAKLQAKIDNQSRENRREIRDRLSITGEAPLSGMIDLGSVMHPVELNLKNFEDSFDKRGQMIEKHGLETAPRQTILTMLIEKKIDELFIFKTERENGQAYVQAMRMVLSRTRRKALQKKRQLDEFKLLVRAIETLEEYDQVTLVRTKTLSLKEESVYDELMSAFEKPKKEEKK